MSLEIRMGDEASRDYEYDFFRFVASNLVKMFDDEGIDGVLIGHPTVPGNPYLKPDCVLITPRRMILIDFKNYEGKMWLPDAASFSTKPWYCDTVRIEGGKSVNPFEQLSKQKKWTEDLIGFDTYGKYGIACMVCFQKDMHIMNDVPGKYQAWFSVTNKFNFINRIHDIITIKNNSVDIERIASFFEAKPYRDYYPITFDNMEEVSRANEKSVEADRREHEALEKVRLYEAKIAEAERERRDADKLKAELKEAKREAEVAKEAADAARADFDEKQNKLDIETQKAIRASANQKRAEAEERKAEIDADISKRRNKTILIIVGIVVVIVAVVIGVVIWAINDSNGRKEQEKQTEQAQLEEDYRNGRVCIPVEKVADYVNVPGVCVDFYVNYINSSDKYVFVDDAVNGKFSLMIPKNLISQEDATSKYQSKRIEARGTIVKYKDGYEIKVYNLNQIVVK